MIEDIGYAPRSLWSEAKVLKRCLWDRWSSEQEKRMRRVFAIRCICKLIFAAFEDIYRYSRIFMTATVCFLCQMTAGRKSVRLWKYWTNQEIIDLAAHSLETSVYEIGWVHPRAGLLANVAYRLAIRVLKGPNCSSYYSCGYPKVESGKALPIDVHALGNALWARTLRFYHLIELVFASCISFVQTRCGFASRKSFFLRCIEPLQNLVQQKLDVPRCELMMCSPTTGQRMLWMAMRISHYALRASRRWIK